MSNNFERMMQVVNGYKKLAEEHNWKNSDQSIFPISNKNIKKFMEYKGKTCSETSIKWYCDFLYKYEIDMLPNSVRGAKSNVDIDNNDMNEERSSNKKHVDNNDSNSKKRNDTLKTKETSELIVIEDSETSVEEEDPIVIPSDDDDATDFDKLSITYIEDSSKGKSKEKEAESAPPAFNCSSNMQTIANAVKDLSAKGKVPLKRSFKNFETSSSSKTRFKEVSGNLSLHSICWRGEKCVEKTNQSFQTRIIQQGNLILLNTGMMPTSNFKDRFLSSRATINSLHVGKCHYHPAGCFIFDETHHLVLTKIMIDHWAKLCASGDDCDEERLPKAEELREFSIDSAR
ncbi:1274_t:CDS:10 [Ambispora leptoticha]|uniref:1274_t:CDS:1 n=1 Tax=Ambispora leptoticha TaxID=144679 RepID=A0A9N9HBG8_9GLOM|nr:1274_t:CDS:10 [Ambispora leptoticha]